MIKPFLELKYGKYVTNQLISSDNQVFLDNINACGENEQNKVVGHIMSLTDKQGNKIAPEKFFKNNVEWGMDFSSWIGTLDNRKDYLFIGAEPHITNNYQLVYDFGSHKGNTLQEDAQRHYKRDSDIWHYLTNIFVDDLTPENITAFLNKCYITDLSHIAPKKCGQVKDICKKLDITEKDWKKFRTSVARTFLPDEIEAVNPKYVILHGNAARYYFKDILGVDYKESFPIEQSHLKILTGQLNNHKIISIPHLKGDMRNKLWKCKKYPERPKSAKEILNKLIS